jgi:uncharacterized protein (TIGR03083 family)
MAMTVTPVGAIPAIDKHEASQLAVEGLGRTADLLASLTDDEWSRPTDCTAWDVRALAGHVLGAAEAFASVGELVRQLRVASAGQKRGEVFIDVMTAFQVEQRAALSPAELVDRLRAVAPKAAAFRRRFPLRFASMSEEVGGQPEKWKLGYLFDVILNRDTWMHRVDLSRATGRPLDLTAEHDGRIVADVVAEWAQRHGRPFTLVLDGPAGGIFAQGEGGDDLHVDAVEFCRILSERAPGEGLLAQVVPF